MPRRRGRPDLASWSRPRVWIVGFLAFFALATAWAMANPLTNVPDEPAHIVKAAATVRGHLDGVPVEFDGSVGGIPTKQIFTGYEVPAGYAKLLPMHYCVFLHPHVPASCSGWLPDDGTNAIVGTSAGGNNPAYYFAVGWTSLISHGEPGIYAMRLVSAAYSAALLASAVVTLAEWRRRRGTLLVGLAAAATPTAMFLNGSVNPNGVEVSSAILAWCALLSLLVDPNPDLVVRRLTRAVLASAVLVLVRPLGPLWILGIVLVALLVGERGALKELLGRRATWVASAGVVGATGTAFWWSVHSNVLITATVNYPELTFLKAAHYTFNHSGLYLDSQVGLFGWLDYAPPFGTRELWKLLIITIGVLAIFVGRNRDRLAVVGLGVSIVAIPVLAQAKQAQHLGYIWQGRYLLAVSVGLPILATMMLARPAVIERTRGLWFSTRRCQLIVAGLFLGDAFVIFYVVFHRYAMGDKGSWFTFDTTWQPPTGFLPTVLIYLLGTGLLGWLIVAGTPLMGAPGRPDPAPETGEPTQAEPDSRILSSIDD